MFNKKNVTNVRSAKCFFWSVISIFQEQMKFGRINIIRNNLSIKTIFGISENFENCWKFRKLLKISKIPENFKISWKFQKFLKISKIAENFWKVVKISKIAENSPVTLRRSRLRSLIFSIYCRLKLMID